MMVSRLISCATHTTQGSVDYIKMLSSVSVRGSVCVCVFVCACMCARVYMCVYHLIYHSRMPVPGPVSWWCCYWNNRERRQRLSWHSCMKPWRPAGQLHFIACIYLVTTSSLSEVMMSEVEAAVISVDPAYPPPLLASLLSPLYPDPVVPLPLPQVTSHLIACGLTRHSPHHTT